MDNEENIPEDSEELIESAEPIEEDSESLEPIESQGFTKEFIVDQSATFLRMDQFLVLRFPHLSRSYIQQLIQDGDVTVNGAKTKKTTAPRAGDVIYINVPPPLPIQAEPEDIPLDVLFEDDHMLIINKPAGICVHPAPGHPTHTIVNAVLHHCKGQLSGIRGSERPGIVHRLDLNTSGALIIAKSDEAHQGLIKIFSKRNIRKFYLAIVCGNSVRDEGKIDAPLWRNPYNRTQITVCPHPEKGRKALSTYRVLKRGDHATLLAVQIHTGRTHQVRVHCKFLGYPLVGDRLYGERQNNRLRQITNYSAPRQMLHAWKLFFNHPITQEKITIEAPLPQDFLQAKEVLIDSCQP